MATSSSVVKEIKIIVNGGQATASINGVTVSTKKLNSELVKLSQNAGKGKGASGATGGATATVLELGRTISDSNYGIRGMANNVSQLASNFLFMTRTVDETTKKAIGFGGALSSVGRAIIGPLGILLGIQTAIALLEKWSMNTEKATDVTKELSDSIAGAEGSAGANLKILRDTLKKNMLTQQEANDAVREANKEYKGLNLQLDENYQLTEDSVFAIDVKIIALEKLAKATALQSLLTKKYGEMLELESKQTELDVKAQEDLVAEQNKVSKSTDEMRKARGRFAADYGDYNQTVITAATASKKAAEENKQSIIELSEEVQALLKVGGEQGLVSEMFKGKNKSGRDKKAKDIIKEEFEFNLQEWYRGELMKFDEAKKMEFEIQQATLDSRKIYYEDSLEQVSASNLLILREQIKHEEDILSHKVLTDEDRIKREHNLSLMRINLQDQEFEHEMLLLDLRMQAQMEYVEFVHGIGSVFSTIGKENEELAKVGLVIEKGAAIAGVVIEASKANAQIVSASVSEASFYKAAAAATAMFPQASAFYAAKATKAPIDAAKRVTKNNIGAGIAIANILATSLTSSKSSVGGRAGGAETGAGGGDRTFDFNLVGSTGTNQLAEAVGSQFDQPVQAYVVSSQMTSQQELDLQISTGASLGGD